jgi:hypothetical protein
MNAAEDFDANSTNDELIQAYLDGETSPQQYEQVRKLLADPSFCERLAHFSLDSACLHELGQQGMLAQPQRIGTTAPASATTPADERTGRLWRSSIVRSGTVMVLCLLLLAVMLPSLLNRMSDKKPVTEKPVSEKPVLGQIRNIASAVIVRQGLDNELARVDSVLRSGDILQTEGPEGFASFEFLDGTTLVLTGDARVLLTQENGQKRVDVPHGYIDAEVAPQPAGKPMLFVTPLAEARVMGTRLSISAETGGTTLSVSAGHVVMKRLSDGRSVDVRGGYHAVASPRSELKAQLTPPVPEIWSADFEAGLPDGWRIGQWVTDDLPENSRGAVRSARWTTGWKTQSGLYYVVRSNRVITGLFGVHDDSCLNFTYKMDRPGWFNLFTVVRHQDGQRSRTGNFAHKEEAWWKIPAGEWRTVSVPLTRFHKVVVGRSRNTDNIHPQVGDSVNSVWFSTPKIDRGLTIDRVWVTRGKPVNQ